MEQQGTIDEAFDVGAWVGRRQAFALVAGSCSAADAEILFEIREKKLGGLQKITGAERAGQGRAGVREAIWPPAGAHWAGA
jgi:hypothetical protein